MDGNEAGPGPSSCPVLRIQCVKDMPRFDMPLLLGSLTNITRTAFACTYKGKPYLVTSATNVIYSTQVRCRLSHAVGRCSLGVPACCMLHHNAFHIVKAVLDGAHMMPICLELIWHNALYGNHCVCLTA